MCVVDCIHIFLLMARDGRLVRFHELVSRSSAQLLMLRTLDPKKVKSSHVANFIVVKPQRHLPLSRLTL